MRNCVDISHGVGKLRNSVSCILHHTGTWSEKEDEYPIDPEEEFKHSNCKSKLTEHETKMYQLKTMKMFAWLMRENLSVEDNRNIV